jgi:hypothetical protein
MVEGWHGDDYLALYSDEEGQSASERYGIASLLPGFSIVGLHNWDDFIVRDSDGKFFIVPTVPCDLEHLTPYRIPPTYGLEPDTRNLGRIKWYTKPIIFGGDPNPGENLTWVPPDQHASLVRWWNQLYRDVTAKRPLK